MTWTERLHDAQRVLGNLHAHCVSLEQLSGEEPKNVLALIALRKEMYEEVSALKHVLHDVEVALSPEP